MITRFVHAMCILAISTISLNSAQGPSKDKTDVRSELAVMQALLTEVRELRQMVRHMAVINGQAQVTIQQMQLQEQRLTHASVRLDDIRKQIAGVSSQHEDVAAHVERLEAAIPQEQDPKVAAENERQLAGVKQLAERLSAQQATLRAQEADADIAMQAEQAKWQDLSDRLSALNQSLGPDDSGIPATEDNSSKQSK